MSIQFGGSLPFVMYLTGGNVPAPAASPTVEIRKQGGVWQVPFGMLVNVGRGCFEVAENIHDTDTPGTLILSATAVGCETTTLIYVIDPKENPRDMRATNELLQKLLDRNY